MKKLETQMQYESALQEMKELFDAEMDTPNGDRLELLITLVKEYEEEHYQIKEFELIGA